MKAPLFRPAAAADVEDAWRWYEAQRAALGDEFLNVVQAALAYWWSIRNRRLSSMVTCAGC